jgi:hypothetical protein
MGASQLKAEQAQIYKTLAVKIAAACNYQNVKSF